MLALLKAKYLIVAGVGVLAVAGAVGTFASNDGLRPAPEASDVAKDAVEQFLPPQAQDARLQEVEAEEVEDAGVPADSPACERLGCDWVETPGGVQKYLPQRAVDGINRAKEMREQAQQRSLGAGVENLDDFGPPTEIPSGPPSELPSGPPDGIPSGPPFDIPGNPGAGGDELE